MKSIARREFVATNGNTLRFDVSPDGDLKVSILKGKHFQGVAQIRPGNAQEFVDAVTSAPWAAAVAAEASTR
jgi:hypothetical protein